MLQPVKPFPHVTSESFKRHLPVMTAAHNPPLPAARPWLMIMARTVMARTGAAQGCSPRMPPRRRGCSPWPRTAAGRSHSQEPMAAHGGHPYTKAQPIATHGCRL